MLKDLLNIKEQEEEKDQEEGNNSSSFVFSPISASLATTFGNFIRRILLSDFGGISLIAIVIEDKEGFKNTRYENLSGLNLNFIEFVINLKKIILRRKENFDEKKLICLKFKMENNEESFEILAKNLEIEEKYKIEIVNPKISLGTLDSDSKLNFNLYFRYYENSVYIHESDQKLSDIDDIEEKTIIPLDSRYSPIKEANFEVNEQNQLTIRIKTDSSISPKEALKKSLKSSYENFLMLYKKTEEKS